MAKEENRGGGEHRGSERRKKDMERWKMLGKLQCISSQKDTKQAQRDGSAVKSICCSCT